MIRSDQNKSVPSAKEVRSEIAKKNRVGNNLVTGHKVDYFHQAMLEFTKLHLQAQLEAIKERLGKALENTFGVYLTDDFELEITGNDLLEQAYLLTNIK